MVYFLRTSLANLFSNNNPENNLNNAVQVVLNDEFGHFEVWTFLLQITYYKNVQLFGHKHFCVGVLLNDIRERKNENKNSKFNEMFESIDGLFTYLYLRNSYISLMNLFSVNSIVH